MWRRVDALSNDSDDDYFIAPMVVAYKSLASCNEGSFSLVSLLKSLLTYNVASDYQQWSRGRLCVVTEQSVKPAIRHVCVCISGRLIQTYSRYLGTRTQRQTAVIANSKELPKKKNFDCGSVCMCNRCMRKICIYLTHDKLKEKHSRWYFYDEILYMRKMFAVNGNGKVIWDIYWYNPQTLLCQFMEFVNLKRGINVNDVLAF